MIPGEGLRSNFTSESDFSQLGQGLEIKIHNSGREIPVFCVRVFGPDPFNHDAFPIHDVSIRVVSPYISGNDQAAYFLADTDNPRAYTTGVDLRGNPTHSDHVVKGYSRLHLSETGLWTQQFEDQEEARVFSVQTRRGANMIAIPKDLTPFVGAFSEEGTFIPPTRNLAQAVTFSIY